MEQTGRSRTRRSHAPGRRYVGTVREGGGELEGPAANADHEPRPSRRRSGSILRRIALVGMLAAVGAVIGGRMHLSGSSTTNARDENNTVDQKISQAISDLRAQPPAAERVYQAVRPGLVLIESKDPGGAGPVAANAENLGTGVIIDTQGDILTSLHVVEGGSAIAVTFVDGSESPASVKSADPDHDIAVLTAQDPPTVIVPAVLGGGTRVGDDTFAMGNPLGLVGSLSAGVISGLDRSFPLASGRTLSGMIQFDAAVNPGNSGGPLLNEKGQVIGIVTGLANAEGTKQFAGIGFAVPIGTAAGAAGAPLR
jgi:S1-C subfamily serine protease